MPSTYTPANGIELITTGEQSGAWGDTTNLNLQIVTAFSRVWARYRFLELRTRLPPRMEHYRTVCIKF